MLFKKQVFLVLFLFAFLSGFSQVVINEVCAINGNGMLDEEGDNSDWIELYNKGNTPVNLFNFSLSDRNDERKFNFPSRVIEPDSFLLIYVSDKNRTAPKI